MEGEHVIMKKPEYAYYYCLDILGESWPEVEEYMTSKTDTSIKEYTKYFYNCESLSNIRISRDLEKMINF